MKWFVIFALFLVALIQETHSYGRGYRNRQRQPKIRPQTRPRFDIQRRPQLNPIQPRIESPRKPLSHQPPVAHDTDHTIYGSQSPSRGDIGRQSGHIVDISSDSKPVHEIPVIGVPPIVRTIDIPKPPHQTAFGEPDDSSIDIYSNGYSVDSGSERRGRSDYDSELQVETTGYTTVFNVNDLNGGTCKPNKLWKVDCNKEIEHRAITAIWDDHNNFKDLDKVKCGVIEESTTLDLHDVKVIDFDSYKQQCDPDYVLTAVFDKSTGFPSVSNGKCTRVANGKLDNDKHLLIGTDHNAHGPSAPLANWKVQCPYSSAVVGIKKEKGRIVALICANLSPSSSYDDHVTIKRY